jgi:hypothetical protein
MSKSRKEFYRRAWRSRRFWEPVDREPQGRPDQYPVREGRVVVLGVSQVEPQVPRGIQLFAGETGQ